jgi:site-specific DNA recombinase
MTVPTAKYLRISEDPHDERLGVTRQNEDLDERFRRRGLPIPGPDDTYNDNNISASKFSRKPRTEYRRLLAAIEAGKYDGGVIGMAVEDRTHRQTLELAEFINLCREHDITPITPYIEYDPNDPDQVSMWFIKVRFAEAEVEKTSRRLRRQRLQAAELGELNTGGRRRFGFVGSGKQRVSLARALAEQEAAREAAARVIEGDSLRGIVNDWNERGIKTSTGGKWNTRSLRQMLLSPAIAGLRIHHGKLQAEPAKVKVGPKQWEPVAPILDRETWEQVRAILTDPSRTTTVGGGQPKYLLIGMVWCGVCGARLRCKMQQHGGKGQVKRYLAYYCPSYHVTRNATKLEDYLLREFFDALEAEREAFGDAARSVSNGDPIGPLRDRQAVLTGLLDRLEDKVADELIRPATAKRKRAEYEREWDDLESKIAQYNSDRVRFYVPRNVKQLWPDYSLDRRRAILGAVFKRVRIVVDPQGRRDGFDENAVRVVPLDEMPA